MILEAVILQVKQGLEKQFEESFQEALPIISSQKGYHTHQLHRCIEEKGKYLFQVEWTTLEDHTIGFRQSEDYQLWKKKLHHFYEPFPTVEHFEQIDS